MGTKWEARKINPREWGRGAYQRQKYIATNQLTQAKNLTDMTGMSAVASYLTVEGKTTLWIRHP